MGVVVCTGHDACTGQVVPAADGLATRRVPRRADLPEGREPRDAKTEGTPPPGYRAGRLMFVLTFGRPPVTGSFAENRAAPDSLVHPAGDTQDERARRSTKPDIPHSNRHEPLFEGPPRGGRGGPDATLIRP